MQKRGNIAVLGLLKRLAYKVGPQLESGNLDLERVLTTPRSHKSGSLCFNWLYKQLVYAEHLLSFEESGILQHAKENVPT